LFVRIQPRRIQMIIMKSGATEQEVTGVVREVESYGLRTDVSHGEWTTAAMVGDKKRIPPGRIASLAGVKEVLNIDKPYKLISREFSRYSARMGGGNKIIDVRGVQIGGDEPVIIAGPCAVESRDQLFRIAEAISKVGANVLRGGVFKPRSSVHSFQGLGSIGHNEAEAALKWMSEAGKEFGMPVVTEIRGENQVDLVAEYADILQIGSRNMYDQDLLIAAARKNKPVFLKRHFGAGIEEFLAFAEYIAAEGNKDVILCERGIVPVGKGREFTRYTLDLAAVAAIRKETYLPIVVDPSHGTGRRDLIYSMSCAAVAAGAQGLMIEVHDSPAEALVDGRQAILPHELETIINTCRTLNRTVRAPACIA
jgi:3-deoxy-7-phosphoheptulonate synthase